MATASNVFKLIGPSDVEKCNGSAVTLSCLLSPEISAENMAIRWFEGTNCVCVYKNRRVAVGRRYEGRVSLFPQDLERGNVSLQLRDCTRSDLGDYLCEVTDGDRTEEITVEMFWTPIESSSSVWEPLSYVWVHQIERKWTEDERIQMKISELQTEYTVDELRSKIRKLEETEEELKTTKSELEKTSKDLQERERVVNERNQQLKLNHTQIQEAQTQVEETKKRLVDKEKELNENNEELKDLKERFEVNEKILSERDAELMKTREKLQNITEQINERNSQLNKLLSEKEMELKKRDKELETSKNHLETLGPELLDTKRQLQETLMVLEQQKTEFTEKNKHLEEKENLLTERETQLMKRDTQLQEKDKLLEEKTKRLQEQTDPESSPPIRRRNSKEELPPIMGGESSSPLSSVSVPGSELRVVLLGRMGSGKSSTGNTILGREEGNRAATLTATSPYTQKSESTQGEVCGRKVSVVDTPDWFSPGLSLEKLRQDVEHCVHLSAPGPHAFLLVIPVKQPTGEEKGMLEKMEEIFGERCWRNTMIIFSVTDELQKKNIKEFIQTGEQEVQRLVEKCGKRFHCLNIKESGDGPQVSELLEKIEKMVKGSREKFYSSEIYLETESQIRAMETKILEEREKKRMREEMEMKEKIEKEVQESLRKTERVIQDQKDLINQLNKQIINLERELKEERDEGKRRELERELKREVERRTEMEEMVKKLKEKRERERREMEERHLKEMDTIREKYEGEIRIEVERSLMKIIMPEIQRNFLVSKRKMQEEFSRQMEEKDREMEEKDREMEEKDREMEEKDREMEEKDREMEEKDREMEEKDRQMEEKDRQMEEKDRQMEEKDSEMEEKDRQMTYYWMCILLFIFIIILHFIIK